MISVVQNRYTLQIISHIDIMLPSKIQPKTVGEFPLQTQTAGDVKRYIAEGVLPIAVERHTCPEKDIRGERLDSPVVRLGTESEEVELRHGIDIDEVVLPQDGFPLAVVFALALVIVVRPGNSLGEPLDLKRPPLVELVAEMGTVGLARVVEDVRRGVAYIVAAAGLHSEFAQIGATVGVGRGTPKRQQGNGKGEHADMQ